MESIGEKRRGVGLGLLFTAVVAGVLMFVFELVIEKIFGDSVSWQGHLAAVIFVVIIAVVIAYILLKHFDRAVVQLNSWRKHSAELSELNKKLKDEMAQREETQARCAKLAAAVGQADEMILIANADGIVEYVNPAFERVTGFTADEVVGKPSSRLNSDDQDSRLYDDALATVRSGKSWSGHLSRRKKNGERYYEELVISPVRDSDGKIVNIVSVKKDVSREVALRTQLQEAARLESVGRLASGIAHDFNEQLTVVKGYCDLLRNRVENDSARGYIEQIDKAAERAAVLTENLLAFGRKRMYRAESVNLAQMMSDMSNVINRLAGHNVNVAMILPSDIGMVEIDPAMLSQVMVNLVSNARDAMPDGGRLVIDLSRVVVDQKFAASHVGVVPGDYVVLSVGDSGVGMDEKTRAKLFEPFFTTKPSGIGTGLGMSMIYGFVQQSNGHIEVESAPGRGTTIRLYLPRSSATQTQPSELPVSQNVGGRETLLVVDDEEAIREVLTKSLRSMGYQVLPAMNGDEALSIAGQYVGKIDMLITDVMLPGITGSTLADKIRNIRPDVKVLYMSGCPSSPDEKVDVRDPDAVLIAKPFVPKELALTIRRIFEASSAGAK